MQAQTSELAKYTRLRYTNKYTMQNWVCKAYVMQKNRGFVFGDVCRAQNCPQSDNIRRKPNSKVKPNHTLQAYRIAAHFIKEACRCGRIFTAKMLDKAGRLLYNTKAVKKKTLQQGA